MRAYPEWLYRLPRALMGLCALAFIFFAVWDSRACPPAKVTADVGGALVCAILAIALEPKQ